jgi:hypothetical protein
MLMQPSELDLTRYKARGSVVKFKTLGAGAIFILASIGQAEGGSDH